MVPQQHLHRVDTVPRMRRQQADTAPHRRLLQQADMGAAPTRLPQQADTAHGSAPAPAAGGYGK